MVKLLLNKGANLSAIDKKERQPIHCAAYLGKQVFTFLPKLHSTRLPLFLARLLK